MAAAQLACLVAVVVGIAGFAYYLSLPPSADALYDTVTQRGDSPLSSVEREVDGFLKLYPRDPRAVEMNRYKQRLELDLLERKLRRKARDTGSADPSLLPAEQLYLRAATTADSSPDEAIVLFQSLVDLYGPTVGGEADEDITAIVALAKQRISSLRDELAKLHKNQLASLSERLAVAEKLSVSDPTQAANMYRAIIELHQSDDWAGEIVAESRKRLKSLEAK
jgi:hypothetical protein